MGMYYMTFEDKWFPHYKVPLDAAKKGELTLYRVSTNVDQLVLAENPLEAGKAFKEALIQDKYTILHATESVTKVEKPEDVGDFKPESVVMVVAPNYHPHHEPPLGETLNTLFPERKKKQLRDEVMKAHNKAVVELEDKIRALNKKLDETLESIDKGS